MSRGDEKPGGVMAAADRAVARALAETGSLDDAAAHILAAIGEALGWEMGALWEVDTRADVLRCTHSWCAPSANVEDFDALSRTIQFVPGLGLPGRVWTSGEPAWITDVTRAGNFPRAEAAARAGIHGGLAFPVRASDGTVIGAVDFFTRDAPEPDADLLETMSAVGDRIGRFVERRRRDEDLRRSEQLKTRMLESTLDCLIAMDHDGNVVEFNRAAEVTFGYEREQVLGREMAELIIPPHLRDRHRRGLKRYLAGGEAPVLGKRIELSGMRADGSEFPAEISINRLGDSEPPMFVGSMRDITQRRRNEEALRFLVEASAALDATLDLDSTLQAIARLSVPYLADGCMVDLLENDGRIRRVGIAAADASYEPVLEELRRHEIDLHGEHPIAQVMKSGRTEIVHDISDSFRRSISSTEGYYEALRRWPARSVVVTPLKSRGKVLGTVSFASFSPERAYNLEQVSVIEELAARAANAVENALLHRERTRFARGLERSLLPPHLPAVPGVEVAARFRPAGGGGEVGGDFYDVFETAPGEWAIAIGDVSGRGVDAAAITVLARHTIHAAAIQERSPSRILDVLNEALRNQPGALSFCSAALCFLSAGEWGPELRMSTAGHPPPLILRAEGHVERAGNGGTLLGVVADPALSDRELSLSQGDLLLLYTNGVFQLREGGSDFGPEQLTSLLAGCAGLDAIGTAERIDSAVLSTNGETRHDDAAILVVRSSSS